jgi:FemAB-related protein (PEP-CTERM system-associated)
MATAQAERATNVAESTRQASVTIASESDARGWDAFVTTHPGATGYHEWAWRHVFHETFSHECIYLLARRGHEIVGILPTVYINSVLFGRTLISLPFLNYGGIVADEDRVAHELVKTATVMAEERRCRHVELRHVGRRFANLPCRQHKVAMHLSLEQGMWDRFDRKVRNQIRKAQKSQLTVACGGTDLLDEFYLVFARNMRDLGTPVYPRRLFRDVLETFPDRASLRVVRLGNKPVAAGLTYRTDTTVEIPWASSIRDFNHLCPNHLLYWSAIEGALDEGCQVFDFGRSTPNEGTYNFKAQWGARPVALHWEYVLSAGETLPNISPSNQRFSLAINCWKRLPLGMANRLGPAIVRAIP